MNELDLYAKLRDLAISHTNPIEWEELHGFGVGFLYMLNVEDFQQAYFQKEYFYSEQWYQKAKPPGDMSLDWPFLMLTPPTAIGAVNRKGRQNDPKDKDFNVELFVFDRFGNDRNNTPDSDYSKRSREQVWSNLSQIGEEVIQELGIFPDDSGDKFLILNKGQYEEDRDLYEWSNFKLLGVRFRFKVRIYTSCRVGAFDDSRAFPEAEHVLTK